MRTKPHLLVILAGGLSLATTSVFGASPPGYLQNNLVSDLPGTAAHRDTRLLNPWGIVASADSVWVNDGGTGVSTVYGPSGQVFRMTVFIPAPGGGPGAPSGMVLNTTHKFVISGHGHQEPSTFLFSTEDGTIVAWNPDVTRSNAVIVVDNSASRAVYKGLALARDTNGLPQIYAADFRGEKVDVFDSNFQFVSSFTDPNLPPNFAPFNVYNIQGFVMVSFALQALPEAVDDQSGPGNGFIDIFDTDGTFLRRFASQGVLNSPWGMAVAPSGFGQFANALLVGNFGDGRINAFDLLTGKWLGKLTHPDGTDVAIDGLWGLSFQGSSWDTPRRLGAPRLYFSAGLNGESDGLLGVLHPPVPPTDPPPPPPHY